MGRRTVGVARLGRPRANKQVDDFRVAADLKAPDKTETQRNQRVSGSTKERCESGSGRSLKPAALGPHLPTLKGDSEWQISFSGKTDRNWGSKLGPTCAEPL